MQSQDPFEFTPVSLRSRRDGWNPARQRRFIQLLAAGCGPTEAAKAVGKTRQTAFSLRARADADSFRAAWDAAVAFADGARIAAAPATGVRQGMVGFAFPRYYRGRLVSVERRYAHGGMLRALAQLDRWVDRVGEQSPSDGIAFEDILELIAPRAPRRPSVGRPRMRKLTEIR